MNFKKHLKSSYLSASLFNPQVLKIFCADQFINLVLIIVGIWYVKSEIRLKNL